jgi:hypothetical protein
MICGSPLVSTLDRLNSDVPRGFCVEVQVNAEDAEEDAGGMSQLLWRSLTKPSLAEFDDRQASLVSTFESPSATSATNSAVSAVKAFLTQRNAEKGEVRNPEKAGVRWASMR